MNLTKPNQNITFKVGATNMQLQRAIEAALPAATEQMKDKAKEFKGSTEKETCYNIFNFLMTKIHYKVDGDNQKIKLPSAFLREKEGDCKSYSLFTASILANLKIPFSFTYASYNPTDSTPEHIYVTTKKGCIIDAVYKKFDSEKKATYKFQKPMNISYISGVKKHQSISNNNSNKTYYIEYLNKNKGFKKDKIEFDNYEKALKWGKSKLDNFQMDMIKVEFNKIGNITMNNINDQKFHLPNSLGKSHSPSIGALSSNMGGIGRTGYDWAKAVGIDKYYEQYKWEFKFYNPVLGGQRSVLQTVLSKNGGGLSNYLWSISPFNDTDKEDTTKKALYFGELEMVLKALMKKYKVEDEKMAYNPSPAGTFISKDSFKPVSTYNGPLTVKYVPSNNATVFTPEIQYAKQYYDASAVKANNFTRELEAAKLQIYAKYPYIISRKSTPQMHEAYRKLETWYFWEMGGSPDDLNIAVREGNTKTPTGASFNLWIRQKLEGKNPSIGLGLQASISAVFGFKYNPDTNQIIDPATNKSINGAANGVGALAEISALILKILAWIAGFGKIMGGIIAALLIVAVTLIAIIIIAPDFTRDVLGIKSNGQQGTETVDDAIIQKRLLDEQNSFGFEGMLIPVGVVAAFLILSK
jgi:hypothetical protein